MNIHELVEKKFKEIFNEKHLIIKSPGRVNLIGEHTDYNNGFVLPAAIDKSIYFAISERDDSKCKLHAIDLHDDHEFDINSFAKSEKGWPNYLMGVVDQLLKANHKLNGFNCVYGGDIPIGAGLSSSAAIEAGLAFALNHIYKLEIEKLDLVKLAQKAENEFVGVKCGIMDQYINIFGDRGKVLRIDCQSLEYQYYPFEYENISIVLFNTRVSHSLATSEYNQRRKECSLGVTEIQKEYPYIKSLRDVSAELINQYEGKLDPIIYKRCRYVVQENERLLNGCEALTVHDLKKFGELMYQSHYGLQNDYEVSCAELDYLVELTINNPKIYGSRMMGGGFGGCTINLIENDGLNEVIKEVAAKYQLRFGKEPLVYITKINSGTHILNE